MRLRMRLRLRLRLRLRVRRVGRVRVGRSSSGVSS